MTISNLITKKTINESYDDTFFHLNRQMQWFLVEAYELYEKFIEELYVEIGYLDNNFWDVSDFGEIQLSEIQNNNKEWFCKRIKKKREKPYSIIKVFEKRLQISKYFDKKDPEQNYNFLMSLISEFRHAIVHGSGYYDIEKIKEKMFNNNGITGSEAIQKHDTCINIFYGKEQYKNLICLTIVRGKYNLCQTLSLPINYDRKLMLIKHILSYSYLLTQLSIEYIMSKQEQKDEYKRF